MNIKLSSRIKVLIVLLLASFLAGCNLPATTPTDIPPGENTPDAVYTAAVLTVAAQLTQVVPIEETEPPVVTATAPAPTLQSTQTQEPTDAGVTEASPTTESSPTATLAPTPTLSSSDPRAALGEPTFTDSFDDYDNWSFSDDEHTGMTVNDGRLEMVAFNPDFWEGWTITWVSGVDFYAEMTAAPQNCSGADRYGILFRAANDASEGYLFGFTCDGQYSLRIWNGDEFLEVVDWTASPHIKAGAGNTNRVGVLTDSDSIKLYANGNLLQEVHDDTYEEGHVGVFVGSANTEDFTVYIDQMDWWDIEK